MYVEFTPGYRTTYHMRKYQVTILSEVGNRRNLTVENYYHSQGNECGICGRLICLQVTFTRDIHVVLYRIIIWVKYSQTELILFRVCKSVHLHTFK